MNTITAFAPQIRTEYASGQTYVFDAAAEAAFGREVRIGTMDMINGWVHYTGTWGSSHEGVEAVIKSSYITESGSVMTGDPMGALEAALKGGLESGRDDRK